MKLPLPVGRHELTPDIDVELLLQQNVHAIMGLLPEPSTEPPRITSSEHYLDGGFVCISGIDSYDTDDEDPSIAVLDSSVRLEIGVPAELSLDMYWRYTLLLGDLYRQKCNWATSIRNGSGVLHRIFMIKFDPTDGQIEFTDRRLAFLVMGRDELYDVMLEDELIERDDEQVYDDEFDLLKAVLSHLERRYSDQ